MTPRQSAQESARTAAVNNKLAAGGAVTPSAAGNNVGVGTVELTLYVIAFALLCGAAWLGHKWLNDYAESNYRRGLADKQLEWDKDKERVAEEQRRKDAAVAQALLAEEKRRLAAEDAARTANAGWEEERREARRRGTQLVVCPEPRHQGADGAQRDVGSGAREPGLDRVGPDLPDRALLTWQFVREYNSAWTGADGKPVSGNPAGDESAAAADSASPFTVDDVLDVHGANARRCSEDRRQLATLRSRLEAAADALDRQAGVK